MIVITDSEATTYCLGVAQIVPLLLIALFVIDRNQLLHDESELVRRTNELEKQAQAERSTGQSGEKDVNTADSIENAETALGILDRIDPSAAAEDVSEMIYQAREEITGVRDNLVEAQKQVEQAEERVQAAVAQISASRRKAEAEFPKAEKRLFRAMAYTIAFGVVAEILMLWAALGLVPVKVGLVWGSSSVIAFVAALAGFTMQRLAPRPLGKGYILTLLCLFLPSAAAIAWTTWLISTSVKITH